jgi:hypothetical protein
VDDSRGFAVMKDMGLVTVSVPSVSRPTFVELTSRVTIAGQRRFKFDNGSGAAMRMHLVGFDATD